MGVKGYTSVPHTISHDTYHNDCTWDNSTSRRKYTVTDKFKAVYSMRGSRKFCQRGSKFDNVFFSWWGDRGSKYHYKWAIIGPPVKRHLNDVSLVGRWWPNIECWLGIFVIFRGIRTSIAKKPNIFVIFQGGGGFRTPCRPLWIRPCILNKNQVLALYVLNLKKRFLPVDQRVTIVILRQELIKRASAWDFQQCGILTCVYSDEPLQPPFILETSNGVQSVALQS